MVTRAETIHCQKANVLSGPVHTYPDIFETGATFSFRVRPPSTRIRCTRHTNPQLFKSVLRGGNFFKIRYEFGIVWLLNQREYSRRCRAQYYRFFYSLDFSFKFYNLCVQLNLAIITVHLSYAKRRLDILKVFPCRTDELDPVNKLTSELVLVGTILPVKK